MNQLSAVGSPFVETLRKLGLRGRGSLTCRVDGRYPGQNGDLPASRMLFSFRRQKCRPSSASCRNGAKRRDLNDFVLIFVGFVVNLS